MLTAEELAKYNLNVGEIKSGGGCGAACLYSWTLTYNNVAPGYYGAGEVQTWRSWAALDAEAQLQILKKCAAKLDALGGNIFFAGDNMAKVDLAKDANAALRTGGILMLMEEHQDALGIEMYRAGPAFINGLHGAAGGLLVYWNIYPRKSVLLLNKQGLDEEVVGPSVPTSLGNMTMQPKAPNKTLSGGLAKLMPRRRTVKHQVLSRAEVQKMVKPI